MRAWQGKRGWFGVGNGVGAGLWVGGLPQALGSAGGPWELKKSPITPQGSHGLRLQPWKGFFKAVLLLPSLLPPDLMSITSQHLLTGIITEHPGGAAPGWDSWGRGSVVYLLP